MALAVQSRDLRPGILALWRYAEGVYHEHLLKLLSKVRQWKADIGAAPPFIYEN